MIVGTILNAIFAVINFVIGLLPDMSGIDPLPNVIPDFIIAISGVGFILFPYWMFSLFIGNVVFWLVAQNVWAVAEWVYKKIPGVN